MFVRFRQYARRLDVSLVEARRVDGKVKQEHVASLGSIPAPPSVADRVEFWPRLNERLVKLSNRIAPEDEWKIRGAVHARVPMATPDEQRALQLENARADSAFWKSFSDLHSDMVEGKKGLAESAMRHAAEADAAKKQARARKRRETGSRA